MIRRPPRSTLDRSSAASDVYKRQGLDIVGLIPVVGEVADGANAMIYLAEGDKVNAASVSYTHLRAHETVLDFVCRLLLEKKQEEQRWRRTGSGP